MVNILLEWERVETRREGWRPPVLVGGLEDAAFVEVRWGVMEGFQQTTAVLCLTLHRDRPPLPRRDILGRPKWVGNAGPGWSTETRQSGCRNPGGRWWLLSVAVKLHGLF